MPEPSQLYKDLRAGKVPAVLLVVGAEPFLRQQLIDAVRRASLGDEDSSGFNEDVFHGKGLKADSVIAAVKTLPMLAPQRFVLVRDVASAASAEADKLVPLVTDPIPGTTLVLVAEKLDGRGKLAKAGKKAGAIVEAKELRGSALRSFAQERAKLRGKRLTGEATETLVDSVGGDLSALDDAVERLSLFVGGEQIDSADVGQCVSRVRSDSIWTLVDSVAERRKKEALLTTASLLAEREAPLRILALVARQLRMVARMKEGLERRMSEVEAAKSAGAPPFKARDLSRAAKKFSFDALRNALGVVAEADLELKGSRRDGGSVLEETVLRLCQPHPPRRYAALVEQRRKLFRAGA